MSEATAGPNGESAGRILVVERDPDVARLLGVVLAKDGYTAEAVDSPAEALQANLQAPFDVAILDKRAGLELIAQLREAAPALQAVVTSIDPTVEVQLQALEHGAIDVMMKPFPNLKLVARKVKNALITARAIRDREALRARLAAEAEASKNAEDELAKARDELGRLDPEALSGVDPKTGVASAKAISERLKNEAARAMRYGRPLTIALCRIDGLPIIGERFGASAADEALRGVSALGHAAIREVDVVGRHGEGDLLFIFPETTKASGLKVAERLRKLVAQTPVLTPEATGGAAMAVTVSLGLSALPSDTMNAEGLLQRAKAALTRAGVAGTNVAVAYDG